MKKSLVALAALAVVGAASAQSTVTLSGKLAFAYAGGSSANDRITGVSDSKNGLGVTDGDFVLTASEDLGGGMKAIASMAVLSRGRGTVISGRDASLTVAGGFGSVMIGAIEAGNGIIGLGGAGAPTMGMDGACGVVDCTTATTPTTNGLARAALDAASNVDILMYTSPAFGGFKVSAAVLEASNGAYGMQTSATTLDATLLRVTYAGGPAAVMADYTSYGVNSTAGGTARPDDRIRISGSYDLGVAKLGAGYQTKKTLAGINNKQYLFGVSAPVGAALTVGANYVRNTQDLAVTVKGYELGAHYALSKRTGVQFAYQNLSESDANGVNAIGGSATAYRVRLLHSF